MTRYNPILKEESDKLKDKLSELISGYNCFAAITYQFLEDPIICEYFEKSKNHVIDSGNSSLSAIMCLTLEDMSLTIKDLREEISVFENDKEVDKLEEALAEIRELKKENKELKDKIAKALEIL